MPIKGIDSRIRLPRIGRFKLGIKHVDAQGRPAGATQTPYFVVPDEVKPIVGDKPTEVRVRFPSTSERLLFPHDMNKWGLGNMLTARCDGETFREFPREGPPTASPCRWLDREKACPCDARAEGRLSFLVVDDKDHAYGPYQVTIKGTQRVADTIGFLTFYIGILGPKFIVTPFLLRRVPTPMTYTDKHGKRHSGTSYPVAIICDGTLELPGALPPGIEPRAIPASVDQHHETDEDPDDGEPEDAEPVDLTGRVVELPDQPPAPAPSERQPAPSYTEDWTHERVATLAKTLGLGQQTFRNYVQARFSQDFDNVNPSVLAVLGDEMTAADAKGEVARTDYKAHMFDVLKKAAQDKAKAGSGWSGGRGGRR